MIKNIATIAIQDGIDRMQFKDELSAEIGRAIRRKRNKNKSQIAEINACNIIIFLLNDSLTLLDLSDKLALVSPMSDDDFNILRSVITMCLARLTDIQYAKPKDTSVKKAKENLLRNWKKEHPHLQKDWTNTLELRNKLFVHIDKLDIGITDQTYLTHSLNNNGLETLSHQVLTDDIMKIVSRFEPFFKDVPNQLQTIRELVKSMLEYFTNKFKESCSFILPDLAGFINENNIDIHWGDECTIECISSDRYPHGQPKTPLLHTKIRGS